MAKIQIKNSFITSSADITISSSLVKFSGGISAKNITGSFSGSIPQLSSYFKQGGNSFGTTATLGTNDNQALIFETNGSTRMYISGSGNVGIGTSSPSFKLHTAGAGFIGRQNSYGSYDAADADLIISNYNVDNTSILLFNNAGAYHSSLINYYNNILSLGLNNSNSTNLILTSTAINITSTGVGIGTSSPQFLLDVVSTSTTPKLRIGNAGSNNGAQLILAGSNTTKNWVIANQQNLSGTLEFTQTTATGSSTVDTTPSMVINSSGNVGIGTTTVGNKLTVVTSTQYDGYYLRNVNGVVGTMLGVSATNDDGTIGLYSSVVLKTNITANGASYFNGGNVGIGTSSPVQKLHIVGSTLIANGNYHYGYTLVGAQANLIGITASDNILVGQNNVNHANTIIYGGLGIIDLSTSGSTRMRVGYNGDVGIGTTTPDIFGRFYTRTIGFNSAGSTVMQINGTSYGGIDIGAAGTRTFGITASGTESQITTVTNIPLIFNINNTPAMTLNSTGLGIGTSSPARKLHVYVTTGPVMRLQTSGSNASIEFAPSLGTSNNRYNWLIGAQQNISDAFEITPSTAANGSTFSTPAILVASSGNIGIGTTSPTQRLDLSGSLRIRSAGTYSDPTDNAGFINYDSTGGIFTLSARSNGGNTYMAFRTSNAGAAGERMRIINDGNVGIGTTIPAYKLDVVGDIHASSEMYLDNGYYLRFKRSSGGVSIQTLGIPSGTDDVQLLTSGDFNILNGSLTNLMTVKNGGNVGIGTTSPVAKLHVTGSSSIPAALLIGNVGIGTTSPTYKLNVVTTAVSGRQTLTNIDKTAQNLITFTNPQYSVLSSMGLMLRVYPQSDSRQGAGILASGGAFNGDTDLDLFVSSGSAASTTFSALKINARGSVGIGTTSPGNKLSVISGSTRIASAALDGALYLGNDGNNIYLQRDNNYDLSLVQNGDSNRALYLASAGSVYVNIDSNNNDTDKAFIVQNNALKAGTELFRVSETGYVGIGTSSPANRLDIWGATGTTFNMANTDDSGRGGKLTFISSSATGRQFYVGTNSSIYNLVFGIDSIEKARINTNGNVGIGTTAPAYKLDVSGSISADAFLGKSFGMTGASGSTAIYDAYVSNGEGEVYELIAAGSPNAAGSAGYRDVLYGKIIIGTGYNGSRVTTYINYVQENPDPRSLYNSGLETSLSASICFKSGSSEVSNKPVLQYTKIRVKIGSYQTGYVGNYTTVRVKRLF